MSKRKIKVLSLSDKLKIVNAFESGKSRNEIQREFNLPESTYYKIIKSKDSIKSECSDGHGNIKRTRVSAFPNIEKCLLEWVKQTLDKNIPIDGPLLKEKSKEFATKLGIQNFSASNGWLEGFKRRHDIALKKAARDLLLLRTIREKLCPCTCISEKLELHKQVYKHLIENGDEEKQAVILLDDRNGQEYVLDEEEQPAETQQIKIGGLLMRWFDLNKSGAWCRICSRAVPRPVRGESCLREHLSAKHPSHYEKFQQIEVQSNPLEMEEIVAENTGEDIKRDMNSDVGEGKDAAGTNARATTASSWDYFDNVTSESAKCRLCQTSVCWSTSVGQLRSHLLRNHEEEIASVLDKEEDTHNMEEDYLEESIEDAEFVDMIKNLEDGEKLIKKNDTRKKRRSENRSGRDSHNNATSVSDEEWGRSVDKFALYVGSLMRMIPRRTALKFQAQIVDRLIREAAKSDM